jgi:hypothetical protein
LSTSQEFAASSGRFRFLRIVFSFPVMLAGLLVVLAVLAVQSRFDDPDMWWHMKMGEVIWTTHTIPVTDLFSFSAYHQVSIPHEWLSQVAIYAAYKWGGLSGLMFWLCFFTAAIFIAGYALCTLYSGNAKVAFLGALVIFLFSTVGLAIRPQMIGYLLLIVELLLIHLGRTRDSRWFWCLPPLFALWINCHGSFFLGIVLILLFLFSSFFHFQIGSLIAEPWNPQRRRTLMLAFVLSIAALFLNPAGAKPIFFPLDMMLREPVNLGNIKEWQPLQLSSNWGILFLAFLGCIFLLVMVRHAVLYFDELLLLAAGIWLAGSHARMLFVFGILAAPTLSRMLSTSWEGYDPETDRIWPNAVLIGIALLVSIWVTPKSAELARKTEQSSPVKAVEFVKAHHLSGPMLNDYTYGGYLIWAMPEHPVFVDGRAEIFEWAGVLQEYASWATLQGDPNTVLNKYGIQFCLLTSQSPMVHVLPLTQNWKAVYSDSNSVIFVRTASAHPIS